MVAGMVLVLASVGTFVALTWHRHNLVARVQAGLPALPDLTGKPRELGESLLKAQAKTKSREEMLEGVAELGRLYQANSYHPEAEACWRLLRAEQPWEARWCYYLADLRREAGDYTEMAALIARTTELAPDYAPAWLHLAELQFKTGRVEDAERNYQRRLALLPGDRYARLGLTRIALQQGRRDQARDLIDRLVKDAPEFPTAHNLYAEMLLADGDAAKASRERWLGRETGRFREAEDPWLDGLQDWCYDFARLCVLGSIESQTGHRDRARSLFERAIQVKPADPAGYELLGSMDLRAGDAAKARDTLERALLRLKPSKPTVMLYIDLAHAYRVLKQPAEAVRVARQGLEQLGDQFELYDALGVALGDLGQHEEAIEALRAAVARNPGDANSNYNLAVALLRVRRLDEAMIALQRSLALRPTFPETLALLAQIEMDSGRWESAGRYLHPLYTSHPEMPQARQLMAFWHLLAGMDAEKKKDFVTAERHYRDGLTILPNHAELQARLGTLCLIQGHFAEAVAPLEAYHRLQPDNPQASLFLGQAYAATGRRDEARRILTEGALLAERNGNTTTAQHCREILQQL
jgi:tetratricopeptide (TPR) repeat protein